MKIRTRLQISVILVAVFSAITGLMVYKAARDVSEVNKKAEIFEEIDSGVVEMNTVIHEYLLHHDERPLTQYQLKYETLATLLTAEKFTHPEEQTHFKEICNCFEQLKEVFAELISVHGRRRELDTEQKAVQGQLENRLAGQLLVKSQLMVAASTQLHSIIHTKLEKTLHRNILLISALLAGMVLIVTVISMWIYASIVPAIARLEQGAEIIGAGNLDFKVGMSADDEIGHLSRTFDQMIEKLKIVTVSRDTLADEVVLRKKAEDTLKEYSESLEVKVQERTAELVLANEQLEQEIVQKEQARAELEKSEARLAAIFHAAEDVAFILTDLSSYPKIVEFSPGAERLFGYSRTEALGLKFDKFYTREDQDLLAGIMKKIQEGKKGFAGEMSLIRKDGNLFPALLSIAPVQNSFNGPVALGVSIDISDRKLAEEELRKTDERLVKAQQIARLGNWEWDLVSNELQWSDEVFQLFGLTPQEFGGNFEAFLANVYPDDREFVRGAVTKALEESAPYNIDHRIVLNDGSMRFVHEQAEVVYNQAGQPIRMTGMVQDITARKQTEKKLHALNVELEQRVLARTEELTETNRLLQHAVERADSANRSKSEFLANMSHEIRTPMNAVMGLTHLALQTELSLKQRDYLEKVQVSCTSLLTIINDILDFSKIEAGKLLIESTEFYLEDVLENLSRTTELRAQEKGIEILYSIAPNVPARLVGDPLRVCQVLINLLSNAIKFTEQGEIEVSIDSIQETTDNITLQFSVRDTGVGIAQKDLNKLFKAFRQADTSTTRKHGGTGLGLTISKKLISLMHGDIEVESEPGHGSTFRFSAVFALPAKRRVIQYSVPGDLQGMRVLVVDDNPTARRILQVTLESFSFEVSLAESGEVALIMVEQACEKNLPFKLVIMDWNLNGMDGIETSLSIKQNQNLSSIPQIIMVTAYGREEVIQKIEEINLAGYLFKPVGRSALFNKIMEVFGQQVTPKRPRRFQRHVDPKSIEKIVGARVLVVEDNRINQQVAKELIESWGLIVHIAEDGKEAVRIVSEGGPKLKSAAIPTLSDHERLQFEAIFMDIQMPRMDGFTATKEIRKREKTWRQQAESPADRTETGDRPSHQASHIPIIAMTAHAMGGDREKSLEAGMDDHITKPLVPEELIVCLLRWIEPGTRKGAELSPAREQHLPGPEEEIVLPKSLPDLDVKAGLTRVAGNRRLYRELLGDFVQENDQTVASIKKLVKVNDSDNARCLAHTLKGVSGNIGANTIYEAAKALEQGLAQQSGRLEELLQDLDSQLQPFLRSLKEFCVKNPIPRVSGKRSPQKAECVDSEHLKVKMRELAEYCVVSDTNAITLFTQIKDELAAVSHEQTAVLEERLKNYDFKGVLKIIDDLGFV